VVELVEGFATVADRFPRAKLAILGKGELREKLKCLISTKNLTERVMLLGQVPQAKKYFKAFDGFVLPSYREGMSIALLEAMATGLPVLVSDIPMNTTVVDQNAIVFEPRSSESVANALTSFLSADPQEHINHGESNRQLVEKNYTLQLFRSRYADLVRRLTLGDVS
jgi:glycosyltransferase involved in cell wall biosynthesis